jgi:hypothetical protein
MFCGGESMSNRNVYIVFFIALLALAATSPVPALAEGPQDLLQGYAVQAKKEDPAFTEFSANAGDRFYHAAVKHGSGRQISCASCHTDNPRSAGRHEKTGKEIAPLAPSVNKARFTDPVNVEKWFKRNCQDVLERACTAREKGNFISYILSVK